MIGRMEEYISMMLKLRKGAKAILLLLLLILSMPCDAQPDLEPVSGSYPVIMASVGSSRIVNAMVANNGNATASNSKTGIFLSTDAFYGPGDILLNDAQIGTLAVNSVYLGGINVVVPSISTGSYFLLVVADHENTVAESDETNNVSVRSIIISSSNPCSNISSIGGCGLSNSKTFVGGGTGLWNSTSTSACGYTCPGSEKVYSFVAPTTGVYSVVVTATDNSWVDFMWKSGTCSSTGWNCIDDINVPGTYGSMNWTAGTTYYLLLDDEDNGAGGHTFYMSCPQAASLPDLDIAACSISSTTVSSGGTLTASAVVRNNGTASTGSSSRLGFYLSSNCTLDASDVFLGWESTSTLSSNQTDTDNDIVTIPAGTPSGTYNILFVADYQNVITESSETNNYCCKSIVVSCITPPTPNVISSPSSFCPGSAVTATTSPVSGSISYEWLWTAGGNTQMFTGGSVYTFFPTASGQVQVRAVNSCGNSSWRIASITMMSVPSQPAQIQGADTICSGAMTSYSILPVAGSSQYNWSYSGNGTLLGTGRNRTLNATSSGTLTVTAQNSCGTSVAQTKAIVVSSIPSQPAQIQGADTICSGAMTSYSILPVAGSSQYNWSYSGNGTLLGTGRNRTLNATSSGTLTVTAQNSCGTSVAQTKAIVVSSIPSQPAQIQGPDTICIGDTVYYSIRSTIGVNQYNWTFTGIGTLSVSDSIATLVASTAGVLTVTLQNSCGIASQNINLSVLSVDTGVYQSGSMLYSSALNATYQWLDCDSNYIKIVGETNQGYLPSDSRHYAVIVGQNGCFDTSRCFSLKGLSIHESKIYTDLKVFPNPLNKELLIEWILFDMTTPKVSFYIFDTKGSLLLEDQTLVENNRFTKKINTSALKPGVYYLKVVNNKQSAIRKIIKVDQL